MRCSLSLVCRGKAARPPEVGEVPVPAGLGLSLLDHATVLAAPSFSASGGPIPRHNTSKSQSLNLWGLFCTSIMISFVFGFFILVLQVLY